MSKTCGFFGNAILWNEEEIEGKLRPILIDLIENKNVETFYVGVKGQFDTLAHKMVVELHALYPHIQIMLVIAYNKDLERCIYPYDDFYFPPYSECGYKGWSLVRRNEWVIEASDYIVACNQYQGKAYGFCQKAKHKGRVVLELGKLS